MLCRSRVSRQLATDPMSVTVLSIAIALLLCARPAPVHAQVVTLLDRPWDLTSASSPSIALPGEQRIANRLNGSLSTTDYWEIHEIHWIGFHTDAIAATTTRSFRVEFFENDVTGPAGAPTVSHAVDAVAASSTPLAGGNRVQWVASFATPFPLVFSAAPYLSIADLDPAASAAAGMGWMRHESQSFAFTRSNDSAAWSFVQQAGERAVKIVGIELSDEGTEGAPVEIWFDPPDGQEEDPPSYRWKECTACSFVSQPTDVTVGGGYCHIQPDLDNQDFVQVTYGHLNPPGRAESGLECCVFLECPTGEFCVSESEALLGVVPFRWPDPIPAPPLPGDPPNQDGDLFPDACDNCPAVANDAQCDGDADGLGDACDPPWDLTPCPEPGLAASLFCGVLFLLAARRGRQRP